MILTQREQQVAALIASGVSRRDLAGRLNLSYSTVDKYLRVLKDKFDASSFSDLVVKSIEWRESPGLGPPVENGPLNLHTDKAGRPGMQSSFSGAATFEELFVALLGRMNLFGATHLVHSHLRRHSDGSIEHLASRWSLPPDVSFDMSISANENLSFKLAFAGETTMPIDLDAMRRSEIYGFVPDHIKAQNNRFLSAGLARGVTFFLPGIGPSDRLVTSLLFQNMPANRFSATLAHAPEMLEIVLQFRNVHMKMVRPRISLPQKSEQLFLLLMAGEDLAAASEKLGISRRAADRHLALGRDMYGVGSNLAALARFVADQTLPRLPF